MAGRARPRSAVAFESAEPADAGEALRSRHVVDRGLEYRALQRQGMTLQAIQRRKRKSKAYVSIVLRFGRLLEKLDPIEVAVLRHPRITYKLLQRVVRADADDRRVVQELRTAITLPKADGRRRRRLKLKPAPPPSDPNAFTFKWEAEWAGRDPLGYLEALEAYLRRVQRGVDHRMKELLASRTATESGNAAGVAAASVVARGGGSLRAINAALRHGAPAAGAYRPPSTTLDPALGRQIRDRLAALDDLLRRLDRRIGADE